MAALLSVIVWSDNFGLLDGIMISTICCMLAPVMLSVVHEEIGPKLSVECLRFATFWALSPNVSSFLMAWNRSYEVCFFG